MKKATIREITAILFGILVMLLWISLFTVGLLIDSSYYRAALNFGFWEWKDWWWAIISFTLSNVALLAFLAGFLGGICSKIIATEGFTLSKKELVEKKIDYVLFENPFISAFRGVFMFLAVLSLQYLSSFSDLGSINTNDPVKNATENVRDDQTYISLLQEVKDTVSKNIIKEVWENAENKKEKADVDSLVNKVILYKDSIDRLASNGTDENLAKKSMWEEKIRSLRRSIKVPLLVDIPGISSSSYFKFAIIVSLLAFICGYDPGRFNAFLSKIPLMSKKEMEEKKDN